MDLDGLYVVQTIQTASGRRAMQLDDYVISYDKKTPGKKTVTVSGNGFSKSFVIILTPEDAPVGFGKVETADQYIAVLYDVNGRPLGFYTPEFAKDGTATVTVGDDLKDKVKTAKLFLLGDNLCPLYAPAVGDVSAIR